jgi:protein-S-isoprenylcysteine O-methyltransferase Ste14
MRELRMPRADPLEDSDGSVMFPPPVLLAALVILAANVLQWLFPIEFIADIAFIDDIDPDWLSAAGAIIAIAGGALCFAGQWALKRRGADVNPSQPVKVLVTDGVFGWTRNPVYLGLWIALAGISLVLAFDWLLMLTPPAWVLVNCAVVRSEERYLEQRFGKAYRDYKKRVPRYLFIR